MFELRKYKGVMLIGLRNLANFHASSRKSKNLHFDGLVLSKAYKVLDETIQELCVMTLKSDPKKN